MTENVQMAESNYRIYSGLQESEEKEGDRLDESAVIERLVLFGLSRQEAVLYICLLKNSSLTGYEVSKLTGISRSNVYHGLAGLVEHGAAYLVEGSSSRYVAVAVGEFCDNRLRQLERVKKYLTDHSPKLRTAAEGYITVEGYQHILDKIHHMLLDARQRVYFSASTVFLGLWKSEIEEIKKKGIKLVLIAPEFPGGISREGIIFYQSAIQEEGWEEKSRQIRLIIDSEYVLTGEAAGESEDTCLYSAQRNFVNVLKEAVSNEIRLIELASETDVNNKYGAIGSTSQANEEKEI